MDACTLTYAHTCATIGMHAHMCSLVRARVNELGHDFLMHNHFMAYESQ